MKKLCTGCMEAKTLCNFNRDKNKTDGHTSRCKECVSEYHRERYEATKHTKRKSYIKGIGKIRVDEERDLRINTIRHMFKLWQKYGEFRQIEYIS